MWRSSDDRDWRRAAGLILLAGILSLTASLERSDGGPPAVLPPQELRAAAEHTGRDFAVPEDAVRAMIRSAPSSSGSLEPAEYAISFRPFRHVDAIIHAYPWPTLLWGIGAGYLLARRVR